MIIVQAYNVIKLTESETRTERERERERGRECVADSDDFSVWHAQSTIDF